MARARKTIGDAVKAVSEKAFQAQVVQTATLLGWRVYHSRKTTTMRRDGTVIHHTPMTGHRGFPDLVLARGRRVLFRELKAERGTLSPDQEAWRDVLLAAGADWALWKPRDWTEIESALAGGASGGER